MYIKKEELFDPDISFEEKALKAFHFQMKHNAVYSAYVHSLKINPQDILELNKIPFLPIEFFKTQKVLAAEKADAVFASSSTTGAMSKHYVFDTGIYIESFTRCFRHFYGDESRYCFLALLPSYLERQNSSLVFMCDHLIRKSDHPLSGFYLDNLQELSDHLKQLSDREHPVMLIGVTYALLDLAAQFPVDFPGLLIVETGGMKGRRKEMVREEVHLLLKKAFGVPEVHSEYGMTELLSQAWSKGAGIYNCPPWMRILIRDVNDPFLIKDFDTTGGINIIDLANLYSCPFVATDDLGKLNPNGSFEVLGRFDYSDLRGCNLMIE